jgi:hypothetical protein
MTGMGGEHEHACTCSCHAYTHTHDTHPHLVGHPNGDHDAQSKIAYTCIHIHTQHDIHTHTDIRTRTRDTHNTEQHSHMACHHDSASTDMDITGGAGAELTGIRYEEAHADGTGRGSGCDKTACNTHGSKQRRGQHTHSSAYIDMSASSASTRGTGGGKRSWEVCMMHG